MSQRFVLSLVILAASLLLVLALVAASCGSTEEAATTTAVGPTTTLAASTTTSAAIDAAALYAENCASCHADGVTGSASEIETIVTDGAEDMPAFGDILSAEEIAALAAYAADGGK
jgi:mono/diheme cytochrome c family protein